MEEFTSLIGIGIFYSIFEYECVKLLGLLFIIDSTFVVVLIHQLNIKMKTLLFKHTPLMFFLLVTLHSCKENEKLIETPEKELSVQDAKKIYESQNHSFAGDPEWANAYYYNAAADALKVPLKSENGSRELVFEKSKDGKIDNYVLVNFPDPDYIIKKMNSSKFISVIPLLDYYGSSLKFKTNGEFINGFYFENGKAINEFKINKSPQAKVADGDVNCDNPKGPWITYCASQGWLPGVTIGGVGTGPTGPVIDGSQSPLTTGPSVGGGFSSYIDMKITDPCLAWVFNRMLALRMQNSVQSILNNFNKSQNLAFKIQSFSYSQFPTTNAMTDAANKSIVLNSYALANASQEFIAKTVYHEVLHVYLNVSEMGDHNIMAQKYVNPMASALRNQFPNLNQQDAEALAWSGLFGTGSFKGLSQSRQDEIVETNKNHKNLNNENNHKYGTPCK